MMRIHHYQSEDDDYFNEYADTIKYEILKDRLHWQHKARKDIQLEYRFTMMPVTLSSSPIASTGSRRQLMRFVGCRHDLFGIGNR
jgi:hypothetical protein